MWFWRDGILRRCLSLSKHVDKQHSVIIYIRDFDKRMVALKCGDVVLISIWFLNHTSHHPSSFHHEASILRASTVTIDNRYRKKTTSPCLEQASWEIFPETAPDVHFEAFRLQTFEFGTTKILEIHRQGASFGVVAASNRWWWWMEEGSPWEIWQHDGQLTIGPSWFH